METRKGDFIVTASGIPFWPLDPRPEDIRLEDIAHHLTRISRWTGATNKFYSVAEHSIRASRFVRLLGGDVVAQAQGVLHDAAEAYMNDLSRPVKHLPELQAYREAEHKLMGDIFVYFGLPREMDPLVKLADDLMLGWEARDLMPKGNERLRKYHQHADGTPIKGIPRGILWPELGPEDYRVFLTEVEHCLHEVARASLLTNVK